MMTEILLMPTVMDMCRLDELIALLYFYIKVMTKVKMRMKKKMMMKMKMTTVKKKPRQT